MSGRDPEIGAAYPVKERVWDWPFKKRHLLRWHKYDLVGQEKRDWEPEDPPRMPTNNPWVDLLVKQPTAPETYQKCSPSVWKYDSKYRFGAKYVHGRPLVVKAG